MKKIITSLVFLIAIQLTVCGQNYIDANYYSSLKNRLKITKNQIILIDKNYFSKLADFLILNKNVLFISGSSNFVKPGFESQNENHCLGKTEKDIDSLINFSISRQTKMNIESLEFFNEENKQKLLNFSSYLLVIYNKKYPKSILKLLKKVQKKCALEKIDFFIIPTDIN